MISRWIGAEPDMVVAASLRTGLEAVNQIERINPDVAVLDIEMPELDGISALPQLLAKKRDLVIIMASTLTRRNAEISFKALSLGAADYIPKPETHARGVGRRHLPPRPDPEDPPPRRQGCAGKPARREPAAGARKPGTGRTCDRLVARPAAPAPAGMRRVVIAADHASVLDRRRRRCC